MFHVKPLIKALIYKGFFVFFLISLLTACGSQRQLIDISDYVLVPNGKPVLGNDGLTAFIFENNPRKIPFQHFLADKYKVGNYNNVEYWVTIDGMRFKVMLYENAELEKYFDTTDYIAVNAYNNINPSATTVKFIALSVISEYNEDCLAPKSLYQNIIIEYLRNLKKEYYNS